MWPTFRKLTGRYQFRLLLLLAVVALVANGLCSSAPHSHTQPCTDPNIDSSPYPYPDPDTAYSQSDIIGARNRL